VVIAGLLIAAMILAVLGAFRQHDTTDLIQITAVSLAMAAGSALLGRHLIRESARRHHHHRVARLVMASVCFAVSALAAAGTVALVITWATSGLSDPVGLVYPASSSVAFGQIGRILLKNSRRATDDDDRGGDDDSHDDDDMPLPGTVLYREACSDVNPVLILAALAALGFGIWLVAAFGGPGGQPGPQGFLVMVPVGPGLWLLFLAQYLPYGIVVTDSYLQLGVRGVPRAGRIWLRARIPLNAVREWDVVSSAAFRARDAAHRIPQRYSGGNMLGFAMGGRHVLWISADANQVREAFPRFVMLSPWSVTPADSLAQDGVLCIGTRRPRALESALTRLLPDSR
jgi:hypothetical protein